MTSAAPPGAADAAPAVIPAGAYRRRATFVRLVPVAGMGLGILIAGSVVFVAMPTLLVVGLPAAAVGAWFAIRRPAVAAAVMAVIEVTNLAGVVAEHSSVPVFHASLALGVVAVAVALRDETMRNRLNRGTVVCLGFVAAYLVTQFLAMLGSQDEGASVASLKGSIGDCAFLVVLLLLIQLSGRPWVVVAAIVVPLAVLSVLTLINQVAFAGTATFGGFATATAASGELVTTLRFGGPLPDSNFWGRHLVLGVPLAGALIVRAVPSGRRGAVLGWSAALLAVLIGVYLTQSRGTIIAAAVAILVWVLASGPAARRRGLMSLPVVGLVLLLPGLGNRLVALVDDVSQAGSSYVVDPSVLGRLAAQEVAWAMFRDRPAFGFGPGLYPPSVANYSGFVDTAVLGPTDAAHNLYAQTAAEGGVVGLIGWAIFIGGFAVIVAIRLARTSPVTALSERTLAAAVLAAIIGWSVASVFLHLAYFRAFAIVLALAGALGAAAGPEIGWGIQTRPSRIREGLLAGLCGVAAAAAVLAVAPVTSATTASQRVTILPTAQMRDYYAYALDIRNRPVVLPTYAAMIAGGDASVSAVADTVRGVVRIRVTDPDPETARAQLQTAITQGRTNLHRLGVDDWYRIVAVEGPQLTSGQHRSTVWTLGALAVGLLTATLTVLVLRRSIRMPRHRRGFGKFREPGGG